MSMSETTRELDHMTRSHDHSILRCNVKQHFDKDQTEFNYLFQCCHTILRICQLASGAKVGISDQSGWFSHVFIYDSIQDEDRNLT